MPLYRKKPVIIEANLYTAGMEDGFALVYDAFFVVDGIPKVMCIYQDDKQIECTTENFSLDTLEDWLSNHTSMAISAIMPYINTLEGRMYISDGDYIITGVRGERYPCKPDIFDETYEKVIEY